MEHYITCSMGIKPSKEEIEKFYEEVERRLNEGFEPIGGLNHHKGVIYQLFSQRKEKNHGAF